MRAWVSRAGAAGLIADVEDGWGRGRPANARDQLNEIADALPAGSGVTSYPLLPDRDALVRSTLWGSPQLYAKGRGASVVRRFYNDWYELWGLRRLVPSLSLWNSGPETQTEAAYKAYLAGIPAARAYVGWPTSVPPDWRTEAFLRKGVSWAAQLPSLAERLWWYMLPIAAVLLALLWWRA
jgi:hypothetical protein